jgi:Tol biopolymer transport system component
MIGLALALAALIVAGCGRSATWSPDSRTVVVDVGGKLHFFDLTSRMFRKVEVRPGYVFSPAFSPDGQRLAYYAVTGSGAEATCDIWVQNLASPPHEQVVAAEVVPVKGSAEDVAENKGLLQVAWSPDGQKLAYARVSEERGQIETVDLNSGDVTKLGRKGESQFMPAWSPGGTHLAYLAQGSSGMGEGNSFGVSVVHLGSAEPPLKLGSETGSEFWPGWALTWSGDGSEVVALRLGAKGTASLMALDAQGGAERKLLDVESADGSITPDLTRVVYMGGPGDSEVVFRAAPFSERRVLEKIEGEDGPVDLLKKPDHPLHPVLSANGTTVALPVLDQRRELRLYDVRTGERSTFWIP